MRFVYLHVVWFTAWIALGVESYPYGLLTMIVSLEAIFLSTFVMISQNRADSKREVLANQQWADRAGGGQAERGAAAHLTADPRPDPGRAQRQPSTGTRPACGPMSGDRPARGGFVLPQTGIFAQEDGGASLPRARPARPASSPSDAVASFRRLRAPEVSSGGVNVVVGYSASAWSAVASPHLCQAGCALSDDRGTRLASAPATQHDAWVWISGPPPTSPGITRGRPGARSPRGGAGGRARRLHLP